ncbi:MAG TPA: pirin family protein [Acidimicrobiales bacterium]|nr:pirin family protein [Acidimicrobiales bacterium]
MSGPVDARDMPAREELATAEVRVVDVSESRLAEVGSVEVRRALPNRRRRTVGAWCFCDHFGPTRQTHEHGIDIGPHPHMGLQTVTWLLAGEVVHRDSLGSEQIIRPGQLNLMTAGHGVAHSEEGTGRYHGTVHGLQLWVAQPSATRQGPAAFEHHGELEKVDLENCEATILVGELAGSISGARRDTDHIGADLSLRQGHTTIPLVRVFEYALVVTEGGVTTEGKDVRPGHLAHLGTGRDELTMRSDGGSRVLLLGGTPFPERVLMWWNFVARTRDEIDAAREDWADDSDRFGHVASPLPRIEVDSPWWALKSP